MKPNERWGDWPRRQERKLRKTVGLPASGDVGNISTLVRELKEATGKYLGVSIQSASACIPTFPAIYDEDLYERLSTLVSDTCRSPCRLSGRDTFSLNHLLLLPATGLFYVQTSSTRRLAGKKTTDSKAITTLLTTPTRASLRLSSV